MSRRSRKREVAGQKRYFGKILLGVVVVGIVVLCVGYGMLRSYLHSDAFRKFLSAEAGDAAGVSGEFAPFRWEGLAVDTDSFAATGDGLITGVRAEGLHTEVGLGGVRRGVWEIKGSSLRRLEVSIDARKLQSDRPDAEHSPADRTQSRRPGWFPSEAELEGLDVQDLTVRAVLEKGLATATGLAVRAGQAGARDVYRAEITGGAIRLPFGNAPELRLDRARLRYRKAQVFLTEATVGAWADGRITGSGEWDMKSKQFSFEGEATDVRCEDILDADWSKRLTGDVASDFSADNSPGFPQAKGNLTIKNGTLTALPMLDALAAYADTRRFRVLTLSEAHTGWRWKKGEISLTNLVLASEGLVRLEGSIVIRGRKMDGLFRLGLAPGTLATIPGAETDVFAPGERGLLWTTLRLTGTLDDPQEDLTDRLIAAAGLRMFEQLPESGEKVLKFADSVLGEPSSKTIEKGVNMLQKSSRAVREVSGILDGLLGAPSEPEAQ